MSDDGLKFTNLDEFKADILTVANEFPRESEDRLKRIGNKFIKIVKAKSPDSGKDTKRKLNKSWRKNTTGYKGEDLALQIWSTSPHFHLADRGHVQTDRKGNPKGFVQGKHFLAATAQEVETDVLPQELEKFQKEIAKKIEKG